MSLCWVSLCWVSRFVIVIHNVDMLSVDILSVVMRVSLCWVPLCWVSRFVIVIQTVVILSVVVLLLLCWVSLFWVCWHIVRSLLSYIFLFEKDLNLKKWIILNENDKNDFVSKNVETWSTHYAFAFLHQIKLFIPGASVIKLFTVVINFTAKRVFSTVGNFSYLGGKY